MFFSIKIYHTACFFQAQETVLSAIGGCSVEQGRVLRRVRCGSVPLYTTKPPQAQGSRLPAMRHRSLNNFHKKWDNNKILRQLCELKKVEILEAEACPDHIHMLVSIPHNIRVSQFMGYLKGKSSLMIFDRHANLKYKYVSRHFWCRGYYVNTAGADTRAIAAYIQNQLAEDQAYDQMTFTEYIDPFTGSKNTKA